MVTQPPTTRLPVLFVGHGSPMNAIDDNQWSRGFGLLAELLPRPRAVLSVSAHWYLPGTFLTDNPRPETIHDFGGFPRELFQVQYPAPGDTDLANRVINLLGDDRAALRSDWGLDHGTWSVLRHLLPDADVPVVQLSIDNRLTPENRLEIGRKIGALRDEGVLIMGSGNITHNLRHAMMNLGRTDVPTPDWAGNFDRDVAQAIEQHDAGFLSHATESDTGRMAHPTLDHYLPLLYTIGAASEEDKVQFPITGFDAGSLSMRAVVWGGQNEECRV